MNNGREATILNLIKAIFFRLHPPLEPHILFYCNGLAILTLYPPLKPQNLFNSYGLAIERGLPNIGYMEVNNGR